MMIRWVFLLLLLSTPLYAEAPEAYVRTIVERTVSSLGTDGLVSYRDESFELDDEGLIEELTLHMEVYQTLDQLSARDILHFVHGLLVRNINVLPDGADYFSEFPVRNDQVGVRLYCAPEKQPLPGPGQQLLGGLFQQLMIRAMHGSI